MKDRRLQVFEDAVNGLVESLEATISLSRWSGAEPKPEPLVASASKLLSRLGAADRLSTAHFHGPATDVAKVTAMRQALKRLDAAYLTYRQRSGFAALGDAASTLETEVAATAATYRALR